ncbi:type I polyketide synthase [Actinomadura rupiterrae]|uniref:type I polyketide synthase n=1 Tax=Actinomadura rupiterrae TaxID=559627 RepID=UPI0020A5095F|nr:type I polyketide synthase [Actinomadura rupiterrae]MCP2336068.1 enediyne polyketide synthase [Actinomadura rupiterrae]
MNRIAVVGMACRYPDAASPRELWQNALAGRRAFRRLPDERMRLEDYWDADPAAPDRFYASNAAVIEGYAFDRVGHRIAGSTYRATDLTHWLALDTAGQALDDAGFPAAEGLPRDRTGVVVGNTLTGEFTRANLLRLRWPYVRRTLAAALRDEGWPDDRIGPFLAELEDRYKSPFPPVDEDTLAGGLSNTIAGRICNHYDLKGGGYTVDGACSSSLLSVATACRALLEDELDVAVAGGVDLSIDPFEIIGFAKTGALARGEMRVYDRGSNGFWPGEGCGMVVLMREADARAQDLRVYASVAGWGISSDGRGGITRPEVGGYRLALRRAYERAGFGVHTVPFFEGHGTGTEVGDRTELTALSEARAAAGAGDRAVIGSVKGMIGHTKAAAGVAGFIKAVMAVDARVLPPSIGSVEPHPVLAGDGASLRVLRKAEPWPDGAPVRAGVTAMGFGGINTHLVIEGAPAAGDASFDDETRVLASSPQDAELLMVDASTPDELRERLVELAGWVARVSYAQLADASAAAQRKLADLPYRAAAVVTSPADAERKLRRLAEALDAGETSLLTPGGATLLGHVTRPARIGFLFPGQGSGRGTTGGALRRRFAEAEDVYARVALPSDGDPSATEVAQPRIVTGSLAGLRVLDGLGIAADVAVGHSLGEITALHWAGTIGADELPAMAAARGRAMAERSEPGTMAGLAAHPDAVASLIADLPVVIAGYNGPNQTVVAGPEDAVAETRRRADRAGIGFSALAVSHAFHSPLVAPAADAFGAWLDGRPLRPVGRRVVSTVTGEVLPPDTDVPVLLRRQITGPVLFGQAVQLAAKDVDLFVEVGPGRVLSGLAAGIADVPAVALDTDDESASALLRVAAAAFVTGAPLDTAALFRGRFVRPLELGAEFSFFASPCEQAPDLTIAHETVKVDTSAEASEGGPSGESGLEILRRLAAERAELPPETVRDDAGLLDDLHLSSITVGQIMNQAALALGVQPGSVPANFATATLAELAGVLDGLAGSAPAAPVVEGAASWVRAFAIDLAEEPLPETVETDEAPGTWRVFAPDGHPLAEPLRRALETARVGDGVLVCLPTDCTEADLPPVLEGAKAALDGGRFVLVQNGRGAAGVAKTLRQENPHVKVTVVTVPPRAEAVPWIATEVAATTGFSEARFDTAGVRRVPTLRALPARPERTAAPLGPGDVVLVTGGGKGITAECALALATDTGAALALMGRSDPADDEELAANLARMAEKDVHVHYVRADVTDPERVREAVAEAARELGPVTAILHGAGRNEPASLANLDLDAFHAALAPKIGGLRAVLDAVDPGRLRLLVTFGSIIGRAGLAGEAHYSLANEWLAELTEAVAGWHPDCRCLCLEWSVWSGVGMGERLSVVDSLGRDGITAIPPGPGVEAMRRLLADPDAPRVVVVAGRTGRVDTVRRERADLPLLRFVGQPLVHYPGVELVTEVVLDPGTDHYLADHLLDGNALFPAVFGMEAMAQAGAAVLGRTGTPVFEDAEFARPVVVPPDGSTTIRIAVTVAEDGTVDAAVRSAETGFAADHFRARLRYSDEPVPPDRAPTGGLPPVALDPASDLYGRVLFQGERFHRLRTYHRAAARHVDADVATGPADWFSGFLPGDLLLGDPGMRDALMHGNQVCVPDATLLPTGIERLYPAGPRASGTGELRYRATERYRDGDTHVYDITVQNADGEIVERWDGLRLQAVRRSDGSGPWVAPLLGPYLERAVEDVLGVQVAVAVEPHPPAGMDRREMTALAAGRALGRPVTVRYRPDGRPEVDGVRSVSSSHGPGLTVFAAAERPVACDAEQAKARPAEVWDGLLGARRALADLVARDLGEPFDVAATRVWAAAECLQKAGAPPDAPLTSAAAGAAAGAASGAASGGAGGARGAVSGKPGWAVLASGGLRVGTFATAVRGVPDPVVFAVLTGEGRSTA